APCRHRSWRRARARRRRLSLGCGRACLPRRRLRRLDVGGADGIGAGAADPCLGRDGRALRMTSVRIGVVGCGRIAQVMHLPFLDELPEFELVALSDISPAVLDGVAQRYPRATPCVDYRELVARDDVDAVAVCTPDHAAVAEEAARAGTHVFVEKPLCFTPEEGRSLAAAVETSGVRVMVGYMRRYDPAVRRLLDELP